MIDHVLAAYGWDGAAVVEVSGGLINRTYAVDTGRARYAVQRLHPVFGAEVHYDIDAITAQLAAKGILTPRLVPARDGGLWVERDGEVWRAMTWIDGATVHYIEDPARAEAAAALVARFHRAVSDLDREFAFARAGVHDTAAHLAKLERMIASPTAGAEARALGAEILTAARQLPVLPPTLPRICHGDLKISNVLFAPGGALQAQALIDLDTLGWQTMAYELGDAMRSWCNPDGEDVAACEINEAVFAAAMRGYAAGGSILTRDEVRAIVPGLETVCIELAARFCADAVDDRYFGWDASRYASRREHNLVRARGQLALGRSVAARRATLETIARDALPA